MARKLRHSVLSLVLRGSNSPSPRSPTLVRCWAPGVTLLYRRNKSNGSWIVRVLAGTTYPADAFAKADDYAEADGDKILTFFEAQDRARKLARATMPRPHPRPPRPPCTGRCPTRRRSEGAQGRRLKRPCARTCTCRRACGQTSDAADGDGAEALANGLIGKIKRATINRLCWRRKAIAALRPSPLPDFGIVGFSARPADQACR
jgi:hypothetical protein